MNMQQEELELESTTWILKHKQLPIKFMFKTVPEETFSFSSDILRAVEYGFYTDNKKKTGTL